MKFLYITDTHFTRRGPESRSDDYFDASLRKLMFVYDYAYQNDIEIVLHGGDLFHHARPGFATLNPILKVISSYRDITMKIVPGNHDLFGWNPESFPRTALAAVGNLANVEILKDGELHQLSQDEEISIYPLWSKFDREGNPDIFKIPDPTNDFVIVMAHTLLVERSFFGAFISMEQIPWASTGDLILGSHYHPGWPTLKKDTSAGVRYLANPGSLMRIMNAATRRMPKFLEIEILWTMFEGKTEHQITINEVYIPFAEEWPFKDEAEVIPENKVLYGPQFETFLDLLLNTSSAAQSLDPRTIAMTIAQEHGFSEEVLKRVIKNLDEVKKEK